jgi:SAM-dependent methyltransferase
VTTKKVTLGQAYEAFKHPSSALFRSIEFKTIYENTKNINFGGSSLDLGCGDGKTVKMLFNGQFTYGVDNGEANDVDIAVQDRIYKKVLIESAEKMSLPNSSVNLVFSNCVIEHIPDNKAVLRECARVLEKGGQFIFTVPSHNFPDYLFLTNKLLGMGLASLSRFYKYRRNKSLNQFHCYSVKDWDRKLRKHDLKIISAKYYMSKDALMLWDKMALEVFLRSKISKKSADIVYKKYKKQIMSLYRKDQVESENGAGLFIHAIKK